MTKSWAINVLHIAPLASNHRTSGLFYAVPGMVSALNEQGCYAALLATSSKGPFHEQQEFPIYYYRDLKSGINSLPVPFDSPDLIVFHSTYIPVHAYYAWQGIKKNVPYIIVPHGGMTRGAQNLKRWKKWLANQVFFNRFVKNAKAIHCLTHQEADDVMLWGRPVFVVGNGVFIPSTTNMPITDQSKSFRIIFIGRLSIQHKGLDMLVDACGIIREKLILNKTEICIYGPDQHGSLVQIEDLIRERNLSEIIKLPGVVQDEAKRQAFLNADIFVQTSRFEGHPIAVLEALSFGLPCILTPGTNMADIVKDAGAGWNVEAKAQAIANGLLEAIHHKDNLIQMRHAARQLAEEQYSWQVVGKRLLENYRRVLS